MSLSSFANENHPRWTALGLLLVALIIRTIILNLTIDVPGDGPTRAIGAYKWMHSPSLIISGVWLPGHTYLHGLFYCILDDPAVAARIFNVLLGTLTVPVFYLLIRQVFDPSAALLAALMLIFLPIHAGLSASSLTEPTFLFEFLAGSLFLILAAKADAHRFQYLIPALLLLALAVMTRYEGWILTPVLVTYYYTRTRQLSESLLIAVVLLFYPLLWTIGNYLHTGDPFLGFSQAKGWFHGAKPVGWFEAVHVIGGKSTKHLGWIITIAIVCGLIIQAVDTLRRRITVERMFYLLIIIAYWIVIYRFTVTRGSDLWDRYLLFGFVLMLPFAALPFTRLPPGRRNYWRLAAFVLVLIGSMVYKPKSYPTLWHMYNDFYVTLWRPTAIANVSSWLQDSSYRDHVVLLTEIDGQAWYFPTYFPNAAFRHCVIPPWEQDSIIRSCLDFGHKVLFITQDRDRPVQHRIENLLGSAIDDSMLVHREGDVRIYDISSLIGKS